MTIAGSTEFTTVMRSEAGRVLRELVNNYEWYHTLVFVHAEYFTVLLNSQCKNKRIVSLHDPDYINCSSSEVIQFTE